MEHGQNSVWFLQGFRTNNNFKMIFLKKEASPSDFAENDEYEEAPQSISLLLTYDLENWTPGG